MGKEMSSRRSPFVALLVSSDRIEPSASVLESITCMHISGKHKVAHRGADGRKVPYLIKFFFI